MSDRQTPQTGAVCRYEEESHRRTAGPNKIRLAMICGAWLVVIASFAFVAIMCMEMLSAARGYTQAEALWSKGQKDAILNLMRYTQTRSDADYERFRAAIAIPLACRRARQQMDLPLYDPAILNHAIAEAGIDERDRGRMIWLYRHLGSQPQPAKAIAIWAEAERHIIALETDAERLHQRILSHTVKQDVVNETLAETERINRELTPLEVRFSQGVAETGYWLQTWLSAIILIIAAMLIAAGTATFRVLLREAELRGEIAAGRRVQDDLLAAKKAAEESSRAKSTFLANMSHELRTPLNAIIGYSEMLREDAEVKHEQGPAADLTRITAAAKHLESLINQVLDLSKVEAGKTELLWEHALPTQILEDATSAMAPLARKNGNTLSVHCAPNLPPMYVDVTKFRQSLYNLLSNACKFTKNGNIRVEVVPVTANGAESIEWRVSDTGIGIAPDQFHKLFRPFSQVDASTARHYGGTGLGLSISQGFCQLMGGAITVASEPGRGSTFTIHIPQHAGRGPAMEQAPLVPGVTGAPNAKEPRTNPVLLIDGHMA
jgi:signal transduction histidine kinase